MSALLDGTFFRIKLLSSTYLDFQVFWFMVVALTVTSSTHSAWQEAIGSQLGVDTDTGTTDH